MSQIKETKEYKEVFGIEDDDMGKSLKFRYKPRKKKVQS